MGVKKLAVKVAEYHERLKGGKANKIKPRHVEKVLGKLRSKETALRAELDKVASEDRKKRLQHKLEIAQEHISRAEFLLAEIT